MRVEVDPHIEVSAKTVGGLRKVKTWPENLVIATPHDRHPGSAVKVSKASRASALSRCATARCAGGKSREAGASQEDSDSGWQGHPAARDIDPLLE